MRKILFLCLVVFSSVSCASNGPYSSSSAAQAAVGGMYNTSNAQLQSIAPYCNGTYGQYYWPYSGPVTYYVWCGSGAKPNCVLGHNTIDPANPAQCKAPPTCKSAETLNPTTWVCVAPVCTAPQYNDAITGACTTPVVCKIAETWIAPSNTCQAPVCIALQVNDAITGACITPVCTGTQKPLVDGCSYPKNSGLGINCLDGSTVYVPSVCPVSFWDRYKTPPPGVSITCPDGSTSSPGQSCYLKYLTQLFTDPNSMTPAQIKAYFGNIAFGLGALSTITPVAPVLSIVGSELRASFPMVVKNSGGASEYFNVASTVPTEPLGIALQNYFKAAPTGPYVSSFTSAAADFGSPLTVDLNTGSVTPVGSTVPLSSNQIADVATQISMGRQSSVSHPVAVASVSLPLVQLAPFVDPTTMPWMLPGLDAIQGDFMNVYNPAGSRPAVNFPNITSNSPFVLPAPLPLAEPLVVFSPSSPTSYVLPTPAPVSTLPSPTVNPNPLATDTLTSPSIPPPTTPIDPNAVDTPPVPPTLYPDTWKYFDFLPMANPFVFDISKLLPTLPNTSCYYEIHRTFQVPFLGPKPFDFAPCVPLQPLRDVLDWAFGLITIWVCFMVIFRSSI